MLLCNLVYIYIYIYITKRILRTKSLYFFQENIHSIYIYIYSVIRECIRHINFLYFAFFYLSADGFDEHHNSLILGIVFLVLLWLIHLPRKYYVATSNK